MPSRSRPAPRGPLRLSVLDQAPIREGGTAAQALRESILLAQAAERFGYLRFWLAEHHASGGLACAAPEVVIPAVAAQTSTIRVGSGGVMLSHYAPLKVAEQFRALEALFPGRIDLGIGRAPGSSMQTKEALEHGPGALPLEAFPDQVEDLLGYLGDSLPEGHPFFGVHASPMIDGTPEVWCLGSSLDGAQIAASLGLPYCFAQFISPELGARAVALYRTHFKPSKWASEPRVSVGVSALCAPTDAEAERLAHVRYVWRFRRGLVPSPEVAEAFELTQPERDYVAYSMSRAAVGSPATVKARLEALAEEFRAEELVLLTITYDFADRIRSYELVAREFGLTA
ncbi:MAG: LLM class flavin-dependent oxidoreductase [Dehalococcoidia bacterium]|nr:MAG: LLM class flavin-dependent oxidoreductase [Dehalococcoidia bacterium]